MGDKACLDSRTWRLLKRQTRNSEFVKKNLKSVRPSTSNSEKMRKKNTRSTLDDSEQNRAIPMTNLEHLCEERVARNDFLSCLGLTNREAEEHKGNADKKINEHKHTMLAAHRSQRLYDIENADVQTDIAHDDVHIDIAPTDVQADIAHSDVQLDESHKESPLESYVPPQSAAVASIIFDETGGSTTNIGGGSREAVPITTKRQRLSQTKYRSIEKKAKERVLEGKKPFLVEVSRDGEPIGYNVARWATELGIKCRAHLDICKSNFTEQDPHKVEFVIQKMENSFDTIGGQISRKHYKNKMRLLMNNFRYHCRKTIIEGKEKSDSTLSPKQWEALKGSMCSEEYLTKSNRGKRARESVRTEYTFGRGGLQAKMDKIGVGNTNKEDVVNYMTTLAPTKSNNNIKWKSSSSTEISQPSVERPVRASSNHVNSSEGLQHIINYLHSFTEKVSQLSALVQPIVSAWNEHNSMNSYQNNFMKATQNEKYRDANRVADIDADHDELVDKNVQHKSTSDEVQSNHMKTKQKSEGIVDSDYAEYEEHVHDIHSSSHSKFEKYIDNKFQEGDKVRVLDPYDGDVAGIGRIHSLSIAHGVNSKETKDANVNIITVTSNVPLVYTDKIDGAIRLKEKVGTFTRWPLQYLQKMT